MNPADLSPESINAALDRAAPLFAELDRWYDRLPATRCHCDTPGLCCTLIPQTTFVEALRWLAAIRENPRPLELVKGFASHFLTNPVVHGGCPFLNAGGCGIYPQRSFACRAYGMWSRQAGLTRTRQSRQAKKQLAAQWQRMGVQLPEQAIVWEPDYCDKVEILAAEQPKDSHLLAILKEVYALDDGLGELKNAYEQACHSDFSFFIACLVWGQRKAVLAKITVIRELAASSSQTKLQRLLQQITPETITPLLGPVSGFQFPVSS